MYPSWSPAHPDAPDRCPDPALAAIAPLVTALGCPFVITDVAQRADGQWWVIEVGDGQVSGLPAGVDPAPIFRLAEPITIDSAG